MSDTRYCFSLNGELFYGNEATREDAVVAAIDYDPDYVAPGQKVLPVHTAEIKEFELNPDGLGNWLIQWAQDEAADTCGEVANDWLSNVTREQRKALGERVAKLIFELEKPDFYEAANPVFHEVKL